MTNQLIYLNLHLFRSHTQTETHLESDFLIADQDFRKRCWLLKEPFVSLLWFVRFSGVLERRPRPYCGNGLFFFDVFGVGHSITDEVFQEDLEDPASLFVDKPGDVLNTTTTS